MSDILPSRVDEYLDLLESRHATAIDLGLDRIRVVAAAMGLSRFSCPVITVAGTNGKGSTVATLEALAIAHNLRVGIYTSPHLLQFNERIRRDGHNICDADLLQAFAAVETALGEQSLTYFEFTTLAALAYFQSEPLDLVVLEVGMGGRLDAVNIVDADVAVLTTVDFDHVSYLGDTLAAIAKEKAGICRAGRPAVLADVSRLEYLRGAALAQDANVVVAQEHYRFAVARDNLEAWQYQYADELAIVTALPQLGTDLVAAALTAWRLAGMPWSVEAILRGVACATLMGRWQTLQIEPHVVVDIGHNPQATRRLRERLDASHYRQIHLVVGMLVDKDQRASLQAFADLDAHWYLASLPGARGFSAEALRNCLPVRALAQQDDSLVTSAPIFKTPSKNSVQCFDDVFSAWQTALQLANAEDMILVFGSFLTVTAVMQASADK